MPQFQIITEDDLPASTVLWIPFEINPTVTTKQTKCFKLNGNRPKYYILFSQAQLYRDLLALLPSSINVFWHQMQLVTIWFDTGFDIPLTTWVYSGYSIPYSIPSYQFSCFNQKQLDGFIWLSLCSVKTPTSSQPNQHLRCSRWRVNLLRYWSDWFKRTFSIYISFPTFSIYSGLISIGFSPFCASDDFWNCNFLKSTKFTH